MPGSKPLPRHSGVTTTRRRQLRRRRLSCRWSAKHVLPGYRLRFYRAENERLRLAYGRRDLDPPRYDIQLLAADVLGRPATDIRASAEPAGAGSSATPQVSRRLFWSVLGLAGVVLLGMTVRLARRA